MKVHIPVLLGCFLPLLAMGELATEVPVIELKPKPEDTSVSTTFVFHNKGSKPVKILGIESACSCLSATLDKAVYAPGEKGTGKAEFQVSSFVGRHEKSVHVQTDDPEQPEWVVSFALEVPEVIKIEPKTLQWWLGDEAVAKTTKVTMTGDQPMVIKGITSTRQNVEFSWKEISPGREYEVTVKPTNTTEVMLGALKIETDSQIPKYQRQMAFFSVYRKPSTLQP
ncbi:Protein of unknown function [Prosthecobacter debontii]|uniref:DUF1573 domain-containing protein n=1 Tax=Prosthecobacter debontii TaxID=48467 RepID=A0A1T4YYJ6_9BACT|nr:DUF1573 domain-containing protein [Prosthecobacter debontii]SKB06877.1 Protein of unknown function [Prosthecobacter debontii]